MKTWIVVADASRARIFEIGVVKDELREVRGFIHPASRMKTSKLVSDRAGRVNRGAGRSAMEARTCAHEVEAEHFAALLASELDKGIESRQCGAIVLVVPPRFLGRIRSGISPRAFNAVSRTILKDLTQCPVNELRAALVEHMSASAPSQRQ